MSNMLCWHRGRARGRGHVCRHCGVALEECPCAIHRQPGDDCSYCQGSGWVAVVRGQVQMFRDYIEHDPEPVSEYGW